MTHIGNALEAATPSAPVPGEPTRVEVVVDRTSLDKARLVLRQLKAAGLKMPFDFKLEESALLWATQIGHFAAGVLNDAVQEWIHDETDCPSVGEFETLCAHIQTERTRAQQKVARPNAGPCEECDGNRWVKVQNNKPHKVMGKDGEIEVTGTHMRPCSTCPEMENRYDLYSRGHFDADHIDGGGCKECRPYQSHCSPRARKGKT